MFFSPDLLDGVNFNEPPSAECFSRRTVAVDSQVRAATEITRLLRRVVVAKRRGQCCKSSEPIYVLTLGCNSPIKWSLTRPIQRRKIKEMVLRTNRVLCQKSHEEILWRWSTNFLVLILFFCTSYLCIQRVSTVIRWAIFLASSTVLKTE